MPTQLDDQTNNINEGLIYSNGWNGAGVRNTPLTDLTYSFAGQVIPYWSGVDYFSAGVTEGTFAPLSNG